MFDTKFKTAAVIVALVSLVGVVAADVFAKPRKMPLPDRNPIRAAAAPPPADVAVPEKKPGPEIAPPVQTPGPDVAQPAQNPHPELVPPVKKPGPEVAQPAKNPHPDLVPPVKNPGPEVAQPAKNPLPDLVPPVKKPGPEVAQPAKNSLPDLVPPVKKPGPVVAQPAINPHPNLVLPVRKPGPKDTSSPGALQQIALPVKKPEPPSGPLARLPELLQYDLSASDKRALKSSINAIYKGRLSDANTHLKKIKDKTARKLAQWYYYRRRGNNADPVKIEQFRVANPDWPSQKRLRLNAEEALLTGKADADAVKAFFTESRPVTGPGKAALAGAHSAAGEKEKAQRMISKAWRQHDLGISTEKIILKRFGEMLTDKDHKARVDRLLLLDRKSKIKSVLRTAKHLDETHRKKIDARIAVVRRLKKAKKLLAGISEEARKDDVGFYFSRIQWLRRHKKEEEAWKLLQAAPRDPDALIAINEWWIERRLNCRKALNAGHPEIAYEIAKNHEPLSGNHYYQAEFLAGWIALRFLNKPEVAQQHFLALRTAASGPKTTAKAEYWLGRTAAALKQDTEARTHYEEAAKFPLAYYGQLAAQTLSPGHASLKLAAAPEPTDEDFDRFKARDALQAIAVTRAVGLENLAPLFFHQLARTVKDPAEGVLLAKLAHEFQQPHSSVRLSKIALNRGLPLAALAYPTNMFPKYKQINDPVEDALVYALSRQESEFNPSAKSPVGARGLMQIMPPTARAIARQHKVRYRRSSLTSDPSYNAMLGVAHLGDLINSYNGSYILTLVAYNAGGGRVRDWTKEFGDPRSPDVDAIDWVERIPFTETRNYVKKIMSGVQIFRARLNGPEGALRLWDDLNRGQRKRPVEASASPSVSSN